MLISNVMKELHEQLADVPKWGGVTDPSDHNPEQFRYLVHAINPFSSMNALTIAMYDMEAGTTHDESWGDQKISMYDQPERLGERVSLSMSLIDQDHTGTWGEAGLIVEAPEDNIVLTSTSDAGTHNNNLNSLLKQAKAHGVMSGDDLLRSSYPTSYNEVVAVANREDQQVQLKGLFYKATQSGEPYNKQLADRMQMHALRLGLPVVPITEQGHYSKDKVDAYDDGRLAVHFNGSRYLLAGFDSLFRVYDERGSARFMEPHEIEPVLGYAVSTGEMTEADAASIAGAYSEADKQRQIPKVEFDEDGTVKGIAYITGYGNAETKVSLAKSGHGYRTNLVRQAEMMQDLMLSMNSPQMMSFDRDTSQIPLSPDEADKMVEIACSNLDETKTEEVQKWYAEHREVLEKQWSYHEALRGRRGAYGSSVLRSFENDSRF